MSRLLRLAVWEFQVQNRSYNLVKYLVASSLFFIVSAALVNPQSDIERFGVIFSVIYLPFCLQGFASQIFKADMEDGALELLLTVFSPMEIVTARFFSIAAGVIAASAITLPCLGLLFNMDAQKILYLAISLVLLLLAASAMLILLAAIQGYFRTNANILGLLIMPLLIPDIIMTGLLLQNGNSFIILIMFGIDLIMIPSALLCSCCLVKSIYHIDDIN